MKHLLAIIAALFFALGIAPVAISGCKAPPQRIAYNTADAVVSSVDIAMRGWADYVVAERKRIAGLSAAEQMAPSAELLKREGKVMNALGEYRQAMDAAHAAVKIAIANKQPLPSEVSVAASKLISVIQTLNH